jgi:uncharacterized repeat protein (TIGR01451 family)
LQDGPVHRNWWGTAVALALAAAAVAAGSASAATPAGELGTPIACDPHGLYFDENPADAIQGPGVITSFLASSPGPGLSLDFVVTDPFGRKMVLGATGPQTFTAAAGVMESFPAAIPVQGGEAIGVWAGPTGTPCRLNTAGSGEDGFTNPPQPGDSMHPPYAGVSGSPDAIAIVEPDVDGDGFGDETQDKCPGVRGSLEGCPKADLSITKTASASTVRVAQNVTYTLTAGNAGPDAAPGVVVSDALPSGTTLVSAAASAGSCSSGSTVSCDVGTLASGASATVTIVVRMDTSGSKMDTATVDSAPVDQGAGRVSGAGDANPANNAAAATTLVIGPPGVSRVWQSAGKWREGRRPGAGGRGTIFEFSLDQAARVRLDFTQSVHRRTVVRGTLHIAGHAGVNRVRFRGWLSRTARLRAGSYTLVITATTPGVGSTSRKLRFTIVR